MIGFGQSWKYSSGGNDFDGTYRTSSVTGSGNDYPYNSLKKFELRTVRPTKKKPTQLSGFFI